jgi:hypothetical protein
VPYRSHVEGYTPDIDIYENNYKCCLKFLLILHGEELFSPTQTQRCFKESFRIMSMLSQQGHALKDTPSFEYSTINISKLQEARNIETLT